MENEALIVMCENCIHHEICKGTGCNSKTILQKLVNRDNPEKVICERQVGYLSGNIKDLYICPSCGIIFTNEMYNNQIHYCPKCGQHLIWELIR